jgi:hypothetical protein
MLAFAGGIRRLVCTTIIESASIPNANTLVVNSAQFGLAQLYQLRGRVGRSSNRAYAYLLYAKDMSLSEIAQERLKTIFEATELGAGMRIAMKDLEIRGAGNLLGAQQSGNIAAVGFDLYTKLLAEQVELLKSHQAGTGRFPFEKTWAVRSANGAISPEYVSEIRFDCASISASRPSRTSGVRAERSFGSVAARADPAIRVPDQLGCAPTSNTSRRHRYREEVIVKFDRLPPLDFERVTRRAGVPLKRGSNQLRFARGPGLAWTERLYGLVSALPQQHTDATNGTADAELPDVMGTALRSA